VNQSSNFKKSLFEWAKEKGYTNTLAQMQGEISPFGYNVAKLLVLSRLKK
jgi:hypothetical protein